MTKIKIVNSSKNPLPAYQTDGSAAVDLYANLDEALTLRPGERALVSSGISISLPTGYEAQVRPRSGWALKHGISIVNSPGTVDSDYRGDIGVILINHGQDEFIVEPGERIAQMVIAKFEQAEWHVVETLDQTERGSGGFGSTNKEPNS